MVVAAASPSVSLWMLERGTANLRQGVWAYSVDGAGTIHYGPVRPADARSALFREILLQAAQACFTRNPSGLSYPEVARADLRRRELEDARRPTCARSCRSASGATCTTTPRSRGSTSSTRAARRGTGSAASSSAPARSRGFPTSPRPGEFHLIVELAPQEEAMQQGRYPFVVVRHRAVVRWPREAGAREPRRPRSSSRRSRRAPRARPPTRCRPRASCAIALPAEADERRPLAFPTEPGNTVEVDFPWPLEDWAGRGFTPDPERFAGDFVIEAARGKPRIFVTPVAGRRPPRAARGARAARRAHPRRTDGVHPRAGWPRLAKGRAQRRRGASRPRPGGHAFGAAPAWRGCGSPARNRRSGSSTPCG